MFNYKLNQQEKGQGLVEYALILVLVAIVVIIVLMLLGPLVGNIFSTINNSLSGAGSLSGSSEVALTWSKCADEDGYCDFTGTHQVRYGADTSWNTGTFTDGVDCTNGIFGDPIPGTVKTCEVYK